MQPRTISTILALATLLAPAVVAEASEPPTPWPTTSDTVHATIVPIGYEYAKNAPPEGIWVAVSTTTHTPYQIATLFAEQNFGDCQATMGDDEPIEQIIIIFVANQCLSMNANSTGGTTQSEAMYWYSFGAVAHYDGPCGVVNPGVDPRHFPYVFVTLQPECLYPLLSGIPPGMEADWRW